jgi:hypothetical protein
MTSLSLLAMAFFYIHFICLIEKFILLLIIAIYYMNF